MNGVRDEFSTSKSHNPLNMESSSVSSPDPNSDNRRKELSLIGSYAQHNEASGGASAAGSGCSHQTEGGHSADAVLYVHPRGRGSDFRKVSE